jgi:hypothetical protein
MSDISGTLRDAIREIPPFKEVGVACAMFTSYDEEKKQNELNNLMKEQRELIRAAEEAKARAVAEASMCRAMCPLYEEEEEKKMMARAEAEAEAKARAEAEQKQKQRLRNLFGF